VLHHGVESAVIEFQLELFIESLEHFVVQTPRKSMAIDFVVHELVLVFKGQCGR
jgi:hypothetical protein